LRYPSRRVVVEHDGAIDRNIVDANGADARGRELLADLVVSCDRRIAQPDLTRQLNVLELARDHARHGLAVDLNNAEIVQAECRDGLPAPNAERQLPRRLDVIEHSYHADLLERREGRRFTCHAVAVDRALVEFRINQKARLFEPDSSANPPDDEADRRPGDLSLDHIRDLPQLVQAWVIDDVLNDRNCTLLGEEFSLGSVEGAERFERVQVEDCEIAPELVTINAVRATLSDTHALSGGSARKRKAIN